MNIGFGVCPMCKDRAWIRLIVGSIPARPLNAEYGKGIVVTIMRTMRQLISAPGPIVCIGQGTLGEGCEPVVPFS